jgi:hypothetical protein
MVLYRFPSIRGTYEIRYGEPERWFWLSCLVRLFGSVVNSHSISELDIPHVSENRICDRLNFQRSYSPMKREKKIWTGVLAVPA